MDIETFKAYQRALNKQREKALKEGPLPKKRPLLEPEVKLGMDISDLSIDNIPINIKEPVQPVKEDKPVKSESKSLF